MKENKFRNWIIVLLVAGILVAVYLVINEILSPGYCPPYPIIAWPACYLVLGFFIIALIAAYLSNKKLSRILFFGASIAGAGTGFDFESRSRCLTPRP